MNKAIIFIFYFSSSVCNAQLSFETNDIFNINWGGRIYYEYPTEIENHHVNNFSTFIKSDNRYIGYEDDELLRFLVKNLNNGNLIGIKNGKDTLTIKEMQRILYWKSDIDNETNDSIRWYDSEKLKNVKIHQKWLIDTVNNTICNYVLGITLLNDDFGVVQDMFYIPFKNEPKKITINDEEIVFIRELKNKFPWYKFNKERIAKILTTQTGEFYSESVGINKYNYNNLKIKNLDSLFNEINIFEQDLSLVISNFSKAIYINQYLYIDFEKGSINTSLNAISPLFPIDKNKFYYDKFDDELMYLLPLYWLNFRKIE
ncbi:MAG TPA: hypothetical protein PKD16_16155 [Saprospiraceae bacterium]|jgi:hypothetical protein|nr:hypothetical protein [Saprospiraceae bacterium]HMT71703.1 hypothetical protein [Saprospiraceae bacterium]